MWIQGSQVLPGNRRVVHHVSPHVVKLPAGAVIKEDQKAYWPDGRPLKRSEFPGLRRDWRNNRRTGTRRNWARTCPGAASSGTPRAPRGGCPKDAYIELNVHYQPSGKPRNRSHQAGALSGQGAPFAGRSATAAASIRPGSAKSPAGQTAAGGIPNIPPFAANFQVSGSTLFSRPATLYALSPHMHLRGKDMTFILIHPDGREEILLSVPKFDFNWQLIYELETPVSCQPGSRLRAIAHYDNSTANRYNPAPDKEVQLVPTELGRDVQPGDPVHLRRHRFDEVTLAKPSGLPTVPCASISLALGAHEGHNGEVRCKSGAVPPL